MDPPVRTAFEPSPVARLAASVVGEDLGPKIVFHGPPERIGNGVGGQQHARDAKSGSAKAVETGEFEKLERITGQQPDAFALQAANERREGLAGFGHDGAHPGVAGRLREEVSNAVRRRCGVEDEHRLAGVEQRRQPGGEIAARVIEVASREEDPFRLRGRSGALERDDPLDAPGRNAAKGFRLPGKIRRRREREGGDRREGRQRQPNVLKVFRVERAIADDPFERAVERAKAMLRQGGAGQGWQSDVLCDPVVKRRLRHPCVASQAGRAAFRRAPCSSGRRTGRGGSPVLPKSLLPPQFRLPRHPA